MFVALVIALAATPAVAEGPKPFRIGLLAGPGAERGVAGLDRLKHVFAMGLGQPVEIFVAKDYAALIEGQGAGRLDYAVYSALAYAVAWRRCKCVEPIVAPVAAGGETGIAAALFLHEGAAGMPEQAVVPSGSFVIGNLFRAAHPAVELAEMPGEQAEQAFLEGRATALLGWVSGNGDGGTLERLRAQGAAGVAIAWQSAILRHGPHAIRTDLPALTRSRLMSVLTGLHEAEPVAYEAMERGLTGGFRPASHADYQAAIDLLPAETPAVAGLSEEDHGLRQAVGSP